ncbi:hypothetical protein [Aquimarina intermedia]|uniref:Long-subunit fatty acid transport protein n=1 Tax=Aquimarina intermedia TaxID=350814 RepID=A0A5S5CFZ4_9FLAO|nr:hypothetical protein [Aquimarina intermedia]TYP77270.1 long-subunit fatty acid transport protein [Aquimarina intermedia]
MIKKILVVLLVIVAGFSYAQEGTSSPYSYYGIGLQKFKGTVENRSMGGLSFLTDSIHINLQNPSAYGDLKLTAYTLGATYNSLKLNSQNGSSSTDNATLDYLAVAIPAGKFGFGFGVVPVNAVGYQLKSEQADGSETRFSGTGGLNRVFLAAGVQINKNLNVGLDLHYNFGNIQNKVLLTRSDILFSTREINDSDLSGFSMSLGLTYRTMLTDKLELTTSIVSSPSFALSSENDRTLSSVIVNSNGGETLIESQDVEVENRDLDLPAEFKFGAGIGAPKNWYVGGEYSYVDAEKFQNRSFTQEGVTYDNASKFKLGGYYIPNYRSLTSYLNRIVYRAGVRYEETGLTIDDNAINEFGISFGVGLPVGRLFSNLNIGFEYGQRGTKDAGLIREDFMNLSLSLSLNDKWFRQIKFN